MANHDSNEKLYVGSEKAQILIHKRVRFCLKVLIFSIKFIQFIDKQLHSWRTIFNFKIAIINISYDIIVLFYIAIYIDLYIFNSINFVKSCKQYIKLHYLIFFYTIIQEYFFGIFIKSVIYFPCSEFFVAVTKTDVPVTAKLIGVTTSQV